MRALALRRYSILGMVTLLSAALTAVAQEKFPSRPLEVITQYPPGGIADTSFRAIQPFLAKELGISLVASNKPGAGGSIASEYVKRSRPDGYTLLNGANTPFTTARATNPKLTFTSADFIPIGMYSLDPSVIVSRRDARWKNLKEFIAYVKANPGKVSFGDGGIGGGGHFTMETLKQAHGLDMQAVHFQGSGPLKTALLGGHIDVVCGGIGGFVPQIQSGELIGLATTSEKRNPKVPGVPTLHEEGIPEAAFSPSMGLYVPAGTPDNVVAVLSDALARVMRTPEALAALENAGMLPIYQPGPATAKVLEAEYKWASAIADRLGVVAK